MTWNDYFETVYGELSKPLVAGKKYEISFYIRHGGDSLFFRLQKIEAVMSEYPFMDNPALSPFYSSFFVNAEPKITSDVKFHVAQVDNKSWSFVKDYYKAQGGERFITFGIFYVDIAEVSSETILLNNIGRHGRLIPSGTDKSYIKFGNPIFMKKADFYKKKDKVLFMEPNPITLIKQEFALSYYFIDSIVVREIE